MKREVLKLLKKHRLEFISGEVASRLLGVSRSAIWKQVQSLREEGYLIDAQPHLGYRLLSVPDLLYPEEIDDGLATSFFGRQVFSFKQVNSTNEVAKRIIPQKLKDGALVIAEEQTGGRGRLGRGWFSPFARGLWFSLILYPSVSPAAASQLTMLAAVAVAVAIRKLNGLSAVIKWPNDVLIGDKKVCGILTEMNAELDKINYLILGIGINVNIEFSDFPEELKDLATSLRIETGKSISRVKILQELLFQLEKRYQKWLKEGFEPILAEWRKLCISLNCPVKVTTLKENWEGWAIDVENTGALLVRLPDGEVTRLVAGDVSIRRDG